MELLILLVAAILWFAVLFAILRLFSIDKTLKKILHVLEKQSAGSASNLLDDEPEKEDRTSILAVVLSIVLIILGMIIWANIQH
jgi:H+/gluconate symporter-like permease